MPLQQNLAPNENGVALHKDDKFVGYEDIITLSDGELAEKQEQKIMEKAEELIDSISSLKDARVFLKKLVGRLIKNGALP